MEITAHQNNIVNAHGAALTESLVDSSPYPPATGSFRAGDYRFETYRNESLLKLFRLQRAMLKACAQRWKQNTPRTTFNGFPLLASGWEWSVFRKDAETVLKVPAGIFPEVESENYLANTELAYRTIQQYFPEKFIAQTSFHREAGVNSILQKHQPGPLCRFIPFNEPDRKLVRNLREFYRCTLRILLKEHWMPDVGYSLSRKGFLIKAPNLFIDEQASSPVLIDFTYYIDPFRLYPAYTLYSVVVQGLKLLNFLVWATVRLGGSR